MLAASKFKKSKVYYGLCENVIMGNDGETNLGACNIHHFE